jgi:hypothetical protein
MRTGGKTALPVRGACLLAGLTFCFVVASNERPIQVVMSDQAISIKAQNISIRAVLEELSRQTNLEVFAEKALDNLVTVDIDQPTLSQAIRSLLRQESYMLHHVDHIAEIDGSRGTIYSRLWIFSNESSAGQPGWSMKPDFRPDDSSELGMIDYQILALSEDVNAREDAMVGFGDIGGESAVEYLQQGLSDPDERVRDEAIESLLGIGGEESIHALSFVLNDPVASLRIDAVDAMGEIGGQDAIKYLQMAMTDENHTVREAAAEWLTELAWQRE